VGNKQIDAVVIGGGMAGLSAARTLAQAGKTVRVLEARERVGGRTQGDSLAGVPVDLGGQWAGPTQHHLLKLLEELGLETYPQHTEGERLLEMGREMRRYRGTIPRLHAGALMELGLALRKINKLAGEIDPAAPWAHADAAKLDRQTAESWLRRHLLTASARGIMDVASRAIFAAETHEYSALHFLTYTRQGGSFDELAETIDGAQAIKIKGGMFQVAQRMAAQLGADAVTLLAPVQCIEQTTDGVRVHHAGGSLEAARAIIALSPALCGRIDYSPALPGLRQQLHQRVPMGTTIKMLIAYEKPFWREQGLSGDVVSPQGPLSPLMDACVPGHEAGLLVGFFAGAQARPLLALTREQRREVAVQCLTRYFGDAAASPIGYVDQDWNSEPWSQGGYGGLFPPGTWTEYGAVLRAPCGRIHWAGTETARVWMGYIDGAIESGQRAAAEVLAA
jgi:monoamine oxidase